jgi:inosose dehydratase
MSTVERIAGAPISWGVSEVPGWGHQLSPERVLAEMRSIGLMATEAGPDGFLPDNSHALRRQLDDHSLRLVRGFTPLVLHRPGPWRDKLGHVVRRFADSGAEVVVLGAATGLEGYDRRPVLSSGEWDLLLGALDEAVDIASSGGMSAVLHPHVGTVVERPEEIERVLEGASVPLCLDTGHVMAGGGDPVALARQAPSRIGHVHFKDVHRDLARRVANGQLAFSDAVRLGIFCVLGEGDVDVAAIVGALEGAAYRGWYVLEQDVMLEGEPSVGCGPQLAVHDSRSYLESLLRVRRLDCS